MSTWLVTIDRNYPQHWSIASEELVWDFPRPRGVQAGDEMYFWQSGRGFVGRGVAGDDAATLDPDQVLPWLDTRSYTTRVDLAWAESLPPVDLEGHPSLKELKSKLHVSTTRPLAESYAAELERVFGPTDHTFPEGLGDDGMATLVDVVLSDEQLSLLDEDRRRIVQVGQRLREDAARFRARLISRDGGCLVTGTNVRDVLQAAHIHRHMGRQTNELYNGLTLRSDIHQLFDRHRLTLVPEEGGLRIRMDPALGTSDYRDLDRRMARPCGAGFQGPSSQLLEQHNADCVWL